MCVRVEHLEDGVNVAQHGVEPHASEVAITTVFRFAETVNCCITAYCISVRAAFRVTIRKEAVVSALRALIITVIWQFVAVITEFVVAIFQTALFVRGCVGQVLAFAKYALLVNYYIATTGIPNLTAFDTIFTQPGLFVIDMAAFVIVAVNIARAVFVFRPGIVWTADAFHGLRAQIII